MINTLWTTQLNGTDVNSIWCKTDIDTIVNIVSVEHNKGNTKYIAKSGQVYSSAQPMPQEYQDFMKQFTV